MQRSLPVQAITIMMAVAPTSGFSPQLAGMARTWHSLSSNCRQAAFKAVVNHPGVCVGTTSSFLASDSRPLVVRDSCLLFDRRIGVRAFSTSVTMSGGDKKKKVVFMGTPDVAAQSLRILLEESKKDGSGFEISAVVSNPPRPAGRKKVLQPSPVQALAEDEGLPIFTPSGLLKKFDDSAEFLSTMKDIAPDLAITAAYGQFLPNSFLSIPEFGTLNIHPSLLPQYRGASPVPRALEAGVDVTGVSVLFTVLQMDAGPIAAQEEYELNGNEKATDLLPILFERGSRLLVDTLPAVWSGDKSQDGAGCILQEEAAVTHAAKMSKEEGELWFTENAKYMHNKVRAFAGWPGTTAELVLDPRGKEEEKIKVKIVTTRMLRAEGGAVLGVHEIKMNQKGDAMVITCDDGSQLEVLEVQPPNKRVKRPLDLMFRMDVMKCSFVQQ